MKALHMVAWILLVVGGLNWALFGMWNMNLVESILGVGSVATVVYLLIGLSAVWELFTHWKHCKMCKPGM